MDLLPRGRRHDDQPRKWHEAQEFIERPRMMGESEADYKGRQSLAKLSAQILASLAKAQKWRTQ